MNRRAYAVLVATVLAFLLLLFLYSIAEVLLLFFIAVLFAVYLSAITDSLQQRLAIPRVAGLFVAVVLTLLATAGVLYLIVPPVLQQSQELIQAMPTLMARWEEQLIEAARRSAFWGALLGPLQEGESYTGLVVAQIGGYFRGIVPYLFSGFTFLIHFISVMVMGIYLALRPSLYREGFILLMPPVHRELVRDILADLGRTLKAWIVGQILAMTVLGVLTWVGLELLEVPYALAFGVFTGAAAIVPFFGTLFSTILPAFFVLGTGGLIQAFWVIVLGIAVHAFEANIVAPMIMERQALHPLRADHGAPAPRRRYPRRRPRPRRGHGRRPPRLRPPPARGQRLPPRHPRPPRRAEAARLRRRARSPRRLRAHDPLTARGVGTEFARSRGLRYPTRS
jgi:predicted PurR-regulated permease PerM